MLGLLLFSDCCTYRVLTSRVTTSDENINVKQVGGVVVTILRKLCQDRRLCAPANGSFIRVWQSALG